MRSRLKLVLLLGLAGCFNRAADHCPGCVILTRPSVAPPPLAGRVRVVLVGGGFGFGDEWRPVIAALRATHADFYVFAWPGPFRDPPGHAQALVRLLQHDLDRAPLERLVILAHSAGGMLGGWVVRKLRVPPGKQVFLAAIASGREMNFAPYVPDEKVNTPMGMAMGGERPPIPPIPPGVTVVQYRTENPPPQPPLGEVFLGAKVGHDESVGLVGVPLVQASSRPGDLWYR
jgi:pimeloyl-ACP methyl ester carboxylesterase